MENKIIPIKKTKALEDVIVGNKVRKIIVKNKASEDVIKKSIQTHFDNLIKLKELAERIEPLKKEFDKLKRDEEKRLERITKDMTLLDIEKFKMDKFIAKMVLVPKFKSYAPPYKELWQFALDTVGQRLHKLFEKTERTYVQEKVDAKKQIITFLPNENPT